MSFRDACIPVRLGWSSPFTRWQGPLAEVSSLDLAAQVTTDALARSGLPAAEVTGIVLGWTVPQPEIFYGASTLAAGSAHRTPPAPCCRRPAPPRRRAWRPRPCGWKPAWTSCRW